MLRVGLYKISYTIIVKKLCVLIMITEEDRELFRAEMQGVMPLSVSEKKQAAVRAARQDSATVQKISTPFACTKLSVESQITSVRSQIKLKLNPFTPSDLGVVWLNAEDVLCFQGSGLSAQDFKRLRLGHMPIQDVLDLHGDTVEVAGDRLFKFMRRACNRHYRTVKIIHGKGLHAVDGTAKLKSYVAYWLPRFDAVMAYHSAPFSLGGHGAVLVLLHRELRRDNR